MENRINLAELLKDCPSGMELDCTMYEGAELDCVTKDKNYPIRIIIKDDIDGNVEISLTKDGYYNMYHNPKCVIFPKGKTTWEGFVPPCKFNDGDIVVCGESRIDEYVSIFKIDKTIDTFYYHAMLTLYTPKPRLKTEDWALSVNIRLANEEEKQKLFDAIKDNGYRWDAENRTLEKFEPKFKVGDRIRSIISSSCYTILDIKNDQYFIKSDIEKYPYQLPFSNEITYELVPNKFDISKLKPFDKVLTRANNDDSWVCNFYSHRIKDYYVVLNAELAPQCIPYEGNEHLLGTTDDCDEYYKNWE